jgi:hypothetical protein
MGMLAVGVSMVEHRTLREIAGAYTTMRSPGGLVSDAVAWISDYRVRFRTPAAGATFAEVVLSP